MLTGRYHDQWVPGAGERAVTGLVMFLARRLGILMKKEYIYHSFSRKQNCLAQKTVRR